MTEQRELYFINEELEGRAKQVLGVGDEIKKGMFFYLTKSQAVILEAEGVKLTIDQLITPVIESKDALDELVHEGVIQSTEQTTLDLGRGPILPKSVGELSQVLVRNGINILRYGTGYAKTIDQLYKEIVEHECLLYMNKRSKLTRVVYVLSLILSSGDGKYLIEASQTFHATDKREQFTRTRYCAISEKLLPDEATIYAMQRALKEELGIINNRAELSLGIVKTFTEKEQRSSMSYPELAVEYFVTKILVDNTVAKLLIEDGHIHTEFFSDKTPRLTATWQWKTKDEIERRNPSLARDIETLLKTSNN